MTTDPLRGQLTTWPLVREYVWAGNATFTLVSKKTGLRFTFKLTAKKEDIANKLDDVTYFAKLLRGPDNSNDFQYMGVARKPGKFFLTGASRLTRDAASFKALVWFLQEMAQERPVIGTTLEVWHTGQCGRCGRSLSVPKSVADGIGPECAGRIAA